MCLRSQGRSCLLLPYTPESWEQQVSCGPSLPLTSCAGLDAPSSAHSAFQESSGQAAPVGTAAGRAERECILSVSSLPALVHFPGWPASQKPMGLQSSASSLAEVCVAPSALQWPLTAEPLATQPEHSGAGPTWNPSKDAEQSCPGTAGWEEEREVEVDFQTSPVSDISSELLEASSPSPDAITCITLPCEPPSPRPCPWDGPSQFSPSSLVIHVCFLSCGSAVPSC